MDATLKAAMAAGANGKHERGVSKVSRRSFQTSRKTHSSERGIWDVVL